MSTVKKSLTNYVSHVLHLSLSSLQVTDLLSIRATSKKEGVFFLQMTIYASVNVMGINFKSNKF